jgi:hypothetical protein
MVALVIEGLVMLGEHSQATELYPLIDGLLETGAVVLLADRPLHAHPRRCRRCSSTSVGGR